MKAKMVAFIMEKYINKSIVPLFYNNFYLIGDSKD